MKAYVTEFTGSFFIISTLMLTGNTPLAVAAMWAAMIVVGSTVSGAHFSPALTLALWLRQKISSHRAIYYVAAQIAGGIIAALVYYLLRSNWYVPTPAPSVGFSNTIFVEFIFGFALAVVFLRLRGEAKQPNSLLALTIGLVVLATGYAAGPISGGFINPAAAIGPILLSYSSVNAINMLAYVLGPAAGAALASLIAD